MTKMGEHISTQDAEEFVSWTLPSFDQDTGDIIASEEKLAQDRRAAEIGEDESIDELEAEVEPLTAQQLEEIRLQAHKEGYQSGYDEGHKHGLDAGTQEGRQQGEQAIRSELEPALRSETESLSELNRSLQTAFAEQQEQLKPLVLNMVTGLARQFIEKELQQNPQLLLHIIQKGLQALPGKPEELVVQVHPDRQAMVQDKLRLPEGEFLVRANPDFGPWDCQLVNDCSRVSLDFEARWQSLLEQFARGDLAEDDSTDTPAENALVNELSEDLDMAMGDPASVQKDSTPNPQSGV
ncbi:FliH/SctL family protein [Pseudoteredinibacter isoporae]|uniref:FliH/SctL family protein n=1 Tax=Pseudoteredinibacter isoporae TaxID=570281 RepID=UPI0031065080